MVSILHASGRWPILSPTSPRRALSDDFQLLLKLLPIPVVLGIAGGVIPAFWPPAPKLRSYFQHFAAGLVMGIIAVDLLPEVRENGEPVAVLAGFAVGAALMVGLKHVSRRVEEASSESKNPVGFLAAAGVDTLIDGVIVGAGFAVSSELGVLLALGLGIELHALNLSLAAEFQKMDASRRRTIAMTSGISMMLAVGAIGGGYLLSGRPESELAVILAFAAAALLYLVTEELLVKGQETASTAATSAVFFVGFIALMAFTLWVND